MLKHIPGTRSPLAGEHRWHVLIEATSVDASEDPRAELERMLEAALGEGLIQDAAIAANEAQAEAFWRLRDSISEAERASGFSVAHDISVAVADMPRFMVAAAAEVESAFPGAKASAFGHLGDGNVHFHVRLESGQTEKASAITRLVHDLVTAAGGSISAEHGIGQMKRDELERLAPPGRLAALRGIKHALDPNGIDESGEAGSLGRSGLGAPIEALSKLQLRQEVLHHLGDLFLRPKAHARSGPIPAGKGLAVLEAEDDAAVSQMLLAQPAIVLDEAPGQMREPDDDCRGGQKGEHPENVAWLFQNMDRRTGEKRIPDQCRDKRYSGRKIPFQENRGDQHEWHVGRESEACHKAVNRSP